MRQKSFFRGGGEKIRRSAKRFAVILFAIVLSTTGASCGERASSGEINGLTRYSKTIADCFDTYISFTAYSESAEAFNEAFGLFEDEMLRLSELYDIYEEYDGRENLCSLNLRAGREAIEAEPEIIELLEFGKEVYGFTGGEVNIAMGSVLRLWHDARELANEDPEAAYLPSAEELSEAAKHTDIDELIIDVEKGCAYIADPEMRVDVGAVAKGFATEKAAEKLLESGYTDFLIDAGGNVRSAGTKPDGSSWVVGLENPDSGGLFGTKLAEEDVLLRRYEADAEGLAVSTSGSYLRYFKYKDRLYSHIIDKDTLMPSDRYLSVCVLGKDAGLCDALSTALFNLDMGEGRSLLNSFGSGLKAVWVLPDGDVAESEE